MGLHDYMIYLFLFHTFIFFAQVTKFRLKGPCIQVLFSKLIRCALLKIHKKSQHHGIMFCIRCVQVPINVICHVKKWLQFYSRTRYRTLSNKLFFETPAFLLSSFYNRCCKPLDILLNKKYFVTTCQS